MNVRKAFRLIGSLNKNHSHDSSWKTIDDPWADLGLLIKVEEDPVDPALVEL